MNLLQTRRFLPLFITQFFGAFNDNAFKNAFLIWFTYDIALKSEFSIGFMITIASALFILPFFLFSALAGQISDKYEKSQLVQFIKISEIIIMAFSFIGFYYENIFLLLILLSLMGVHSSFFGPLKYALLPEHLHKNELVLGNALVEGGTFLAILLGTIFGGIIICTENGIEIICFAVLSFAVIGYFASRKIPKTQIGEEKLAINFNIFSATYNIIKQAKQNQTIWSSIVKISWFWFVGATFLSQFPLFVKDTIHADQYVVTLFLSIFSIGIAFGSFLCSKILKGKINAKLVPYGLIGISLGIATLYYASINYALQLETTELLSIDDFLKQNIFSYQIIAALLIIALSGGIYIVPLYSIMQHKADEKYLSRIIAANNIMSAFAMTISAIAILICYKFHFEILTIFALVGIINLAFISKIKL